ncbi:MAG: RluA family pseudouridine synthase [Acetivibrio sp.]
MKQEELNIIFEDEDILVCIKPQGVPSQSDKTGDFDMVNQLKNFLFRKSPSQGEPYVGLIHRLDRPVGGIMVFAKNKEAAKILSESIRNRDMTKRYLAVLNYNKEPVKKEEQLLTDYMIKDGRTNLSKITNAQDKNGKKAQLTYRIREIKEEYSLAEILLLTGRHHQIRLQMAAHLGGIVGDTKYNPLYQEKKGWNKMGLYAYELTLIHPKTKKRMSFQSIPKEEPFDLFFPEK